MNQENSQAKDTKRTHWTSYASQNTFEISEDALGCAEHFEAQNDSWIDDNHIQPSVSR